MGSEIPSHNLDLLWLRQRLEEGSLEDQQKAEEGNDPRCSEAGWLSGEGVIQSQRGIPCSFFNDRIMVYLWFVVPWLTLAGRCPGWQGLALALPVPTLRVVVRVVDRRSHIDPTGPLPSLAHWGMLGAACPIHLPT